MIRGLTKVVSSIGGLRGIQKPMQAAAAVGQDLVGKDRQMRTASVPIPRIELEKDGHEPFGADQKKMTQRYLVHDEIPSKGARTYLVYKMSTQDKVHMNLEDLPVNLHAPFIKYFIKTLATESEEKEKSSQTILFNHVSESVFRYFLNMQVRKLGYKSTFTKYNHERGIALFEPVKGESHETALDRTRLRMLQTRR